MTTLGALAAARVISYSDGYRTKRSELADEGFQILRVADVHDGWIDLDAAEFVSAEYESRIGQKAARDGDILVTTKGTVGRVAAVSGIGDRRVVYSPQLCYFRVLDERTVDRGFLAAWFRSSAFAQQARVYSGNTDMAPYLSLRDISTIELPLHDLDVQCAIAGVLGALDDKIAANRAVAKIGAHWMRMRWQQLTENSDVTAQWSDVVEANPSTPTKRGEDVAYLDMKNLPQGGLLVERWERREPKGGARFVNGDTLLARITPCFENGKLGVVDFLDPGEIGYGSTEFIVYRPRESVPTAVPYCVVSDEGFRTEAAKSMTGTSGRQRVQASSLTDYELSWPSSSDLTEFGKVTDVLLQRIGAARDENTVLARTRDELLPLLMDGRITVREAGQTVKEVL